MNELRKVTMTIADVDPGTGLVSVNFDMDPKPDPEALMEDLAEQSLAVALSMAAYSSMMQLSDETDIQLNS